MTYPCHNNRPEPGKTYWVQDGWFYDASGMTRKPRMKEVKNPFDLSQCKYEASASDAKCRGCVHVNKGEQA